jgi:hypothetical protein
MLIIFFNIKGIVHKEFILADQTVKLVYYCDVLWRLRGNVRKLRPELWRQNNWLLQHDNAPPDTWNLWSEIIWLPFPTHSTCLCFLHQRYNFKAAILTQLRWWGQNHRRCWTPSSRTSL